MTKSLVRVLGLTAILSVSTLARAECTKDTDCKGDRVCSAGACVDPSPAAVPTPADAYWQVEPAPVAQQAPPPVVAQQAPAPVASPTPKSSQTQPRGHARDVGAQTRSTGIGLFILGLLLDGGGAGIYIYGKQEKNGDCGGDCSTLWKVGIGVLALGGLLTVVGLSVWVVGSSQDAVAVRKHRIVPYANVGPSGGVAGFQF